MKRRSLLLAAGCLSAPALLPASAGAQGKDAAGLAAEARDAARKGDLVQALALANRVVELEPKQTRSWTLRAQVQELRGEHAKSASDYGEAIRLAPAVADLWQQRGEAQFRGGKIRESIADFDRYLALVPEQKPHHWQRGISLYYAARYADGKRQFEIHQTVNSQDVENAVWHFLCTTRAESLDAARKKLIPIEGDPRVPMAQVHRLFAGKGSTREVLAAAEAASPRSRFGEPVFYAHLYLGLYYEATGDGGRAREHIFKAAERAKENGYMGDVARIHAELLRKRGGKA